MNSQRMTQNRSIALLHLLFFGSGMAALIYQVLWQRLLFAWFGVDLESMTVIVAVYMFGLGVGGHLGGRIADRMPQHLSVVFGLIECLVGLFGLLSAGLIDRMGPLLAGGPVVVTALAAFLLLAFPTTLMGATLPVLAVHVNLRNRHIGESVGSLYFANTLGAAAGVLIAGFWALNQFTIDQTLIGAAATNVSAGLLAYLVWRGDRS